MLAHLVDPHKRPVFENGHLLKKILADSFSVHIVKSFTRMVALFRDHQNFALSAGHNLRATILVRLIILVDYFVVEDLVLTKLCDYPPVFLLVNDTFEHDQQNVILRVLL